MIHQHTRVSAPSYVLLVEDNDDHALLAQHSLRRWRPDWLILRSATVSDAVEQLKRYNVSVVLLDLYLGETMGLETVDVFMPHADGTAVVVMTSASDSSLGPCAVERGAQDYIDKAGLQDKGMITRIDFAMVRKGIELELKRKYRALNAVLMVLSHDLQAPPRQIESFILSVLAEIGTQLDEDVREDLEFSLRAARLMTTRVQAALSLAKIGNSQLKIEPLELADLVEEATSHLGIDLRARVSIDTNGGVVGDQRLLVMILDNLVGNGLKFSREDPSMVCLSATHTDGFTWLEVRDTGTGIPPDVLSRIFEPGYRGQITSGLPGSGLGLAIVSQAVEAMGGRIEVTSEVGQGTRFSARLPNPTVSVPQ